MKNIFLSVSLGLILVVMVSCQKDIPVTVIKDCTGTYIRVNSRDLFVCNYELLDSYAHNTVINVSYGTLNRCDKKDTITRCTMAHTFDKFVKIKTIE